MRQKLGTQTQIRFADLTRKNDGLSQMRAPEIFGQTLRRWHDSSDRVSMFNPSTVMLRIGNLSHARFALIVLATFFLGHGAVAQIASDPFVQRTTNMGEQMMGLANGYTRDNGFNNIPRPLFRATMPIPPLPPALGEELDYTPGSDPGHSLAADFNRETFYGAYAMLLGWSEVSAKQTERITAYQTARQNLLREIKAKFAELAGAPPAERRAALSELAARQESQLQALVNEAEAIRADLASTGPVYGFAMGLRDGTVHFDDASARKFLWLYFAAYFDAGLSTEQRRLLPEIADELRFASDADQRSSGDGGDYFYFLPATARIRLPANLPPALMEKIHKFASEKESLKNELRSAVLRDDYFYYYFRRLRIKRLTALAAQQAPRFAALEALAEEIRVGLAGFPYPDQPGKLDLPADLARRVGDFYARKVEVQRELLKRLRDLKHEFPAAQFTIERLGDGLTIAQTGLSPNKAESLVEFKASLARRYATFTTESETLRRDIQHYIQTSPKSQARTVDQVATDFARAYAAQENWSRYHDYFRAVLEPGLSPAQRNLLFHFATSELEQNGRTLHP